MDTVIGLQVGLVLVTIVDRVSKFTFMGLALSKQASAGSSVICELLQEVKEHVKTLTYDNGKEFAYHHLINEILETQSFFAHPIISGNEA